MEINCLKKKIGKLARLCSQTNALRPPDYGTIELIGNAKDCSKTITIPRDGWALVNCYACCGQLFAILNGSLKISGASNDPALDKTDDNDAILIPVFKGDTISFKSYLRSHANSTNGSVYLLDYK